MKTPPTPEQAYERMADRCAAAEYCSYEVAEKLRRMGLSAEQVATIVARLERERYIDNARYAAAFVRQKSTYQRWGARKIAAALAAKRIPRDVAAEALEQIEPEAEVDTLMALLAAKARGLDLKDYAVRGRLYRFAAARGYSSSAIASALERLRHNS